MFEASVHYYRITWLTYPKVAAVISSVYRLSLASCLLGALNI
jgi:hypothetical protein